MEKLSTLGPILGSKLIRLVRVKHNTNPVGFGPLSSVRVVRKMPMCWKNTTLALENRRADSAFTTMN